MLFIKCKQIIMYTERIFSSSQTMLKWRANLKYKVNKALMHKSRGFKVLFLRELLTPFSLLVTCSSIFLLSLTSEWDCWSPSMCKQMFTLIANQKSTSTCSKIPQKRWGFEVHMSAEFNALEINPTSVGCISPETAVCIYFTEKPLIDPSYEHNYKVGSRNQFR